MAKAKNKARAPADKGGNIGWRIVAAIIAVALLAVICAGLIITYNHTNGFATGFKTFYVEVNGTRYYNDDTVTLKKYDTTAFNCGFMFKSSDDVDVRFSYKITSTATAETAFEYSVSGVKKTFEGGEDYTDCFDFTLTENGFTIANEDYSPLDIVKCMYPGTNVTGNKPDPQISYFTLTVTDEESKQTVALALLFEHLELTIAPGEITF